MFRKFDTKNVRKIDINLKLRKFDTGKFDNEWKIRHQILDGKNGIQPT